MRPVSKLNVGIVTLNREVQTISTKDEGRGARVETFSPFTDIEYAAHRSPHYLASKLDGIIDFNRNDYVRYMYVNLQNLLCLMIEGYIFCLKWENSYNWWSWNHGYFNSIFSDESKENNCNLFNIFMINTNWTFTEKRSAKAASNIFMLVKRKEMSYQSNRKSFVGLETKIVAECQPRNKAGFCNTPEMCSWLLFSMWDMYQGQKDKEIKIRYGVL